MFVVEVLYFRRIKRDAQLDCTRGWGGGGEKKDTNDLPQVIRYLTTGALKNKVYLREARARSDFSRR